MTDIIVWLAALAGGMGLGVAFFAGLWLTVNGLPRFSQPALCIFVSLLLRFGVVLTAFYLLARYGGVVPVLIAAGGFTLARLLLMRRFNGAGA